MVTYDTVYIDTFLVEHSNEIKVNQLLKVRIRVRVKEVEIRTTLFFSLRLLLYFS
jgi:hypothetical protein